MKNEGIGIEMHILSKFVVKKPTKLIIDKTLNPFLQKVEK